MRAPDPPSARPRRPRTSTEPRRRRRRLLPARRPARRPLLSRLLPALAPCLLATAGPVLAIAGEDGATPANDAPRVAIETSMGTITVELLAIEAPRTVTNFLALADSGFYAGTVFHRVLPNLIQAGGYTADLQRKQRGREISNEAADTPSNLRGTVAMVHEPGRPHSATSEFFINVTDNTYLDHRNRTPGGYGWAVFGRVTDGMDVADAIAALKTGARGGFVRGYPAEDVVIRKIRRVDR